MEKIMGDEKVQETDIANIDKLLAETREHAQTVHHKAIELNNRTAQPTATAEEVPTGDVGIEIREKLIRINTILTEAITSLEAFV